MIPALIYVALTIFLWVRKRRKGKSQGKGSSFRKQFSLTNWFALLYTATLFISYGFTRYRSAAFWGMKGWYMGLAPQLMLMAVYFLISRLWTPRRWLFCLMFPASAAVFLLGCLNRFGIYPIDMNYVSPSYISTIGNINWYCGYAVSIVFAGVVLLWRWKDQMSWKKFLLMVYITLGLAALVTQGSESGIAALGVVVLAMFCMSVRDKDRMTAFWQEMVMLWGSCLAVYVIRLLAPDSMTFVDGIIDKITYGWVPIVMTIVSVAFLAAMIWGKKKRIYRERFFSAAAKIAVCSCVAAVLLVMALVSVNTLRPGSLGRLSEYSFFTFDESWGSHRGATWEAGWRCFWEQDMLHKLVGVGPDCMWEYIIGGASEGLRAMVLRVFGGDRLTNAHNEWLTILVNTGILGLVGFGGMMVSGIRDFLKKERDSTFAVACGFCLLAYTVNNIFSFQQAMGVGTIFVIFGMGEAFLREENQGKIGGK